MNNSYQPLRHFFWGYHNLKLLSQSVDLVSSRLSLLRNPVEIRLYAYDVKSSKNSDLLEKKRRFQELEINFQRLLDIEKLTPDEKRIHFLHAEAVEKGHFTYDDPVLNEKVLTRLRHFLKGKCCGKSCRHCIYEHSAVTDEKKKAAARFNSSFWVYDREEEDLVAFDDQHVITYGRGPYPKNYAQQAPENMIKIYSKPK